MMDGVMPNERAWPRAETTLLVALLALGVFLRAKGIASHPIWVDEYGTWWTIAGEGWSDLWHRVLTIQGQSPFYYALVRISVDALGPSPFALRLPSLLFGVGLLWACLPLAQAIFGDRRVALFAVAAFAVNERLIFYSQEARPYALALFCLALSFLAYLALLDRPRSRRARAAYLLATAATVYAHYLFGVAILIQVLHWLLRRPRRADLGPWLVTAALLAALLAPGAFQLADLAGRREALDWVERTGPGEVVRLWLRYFDGRVLLATTGAALLAAVAGRRLSLQGPRPRLALLGLWLFLPFLVIALIPPLFDVSLLHRRYLLMALPAAGLAYGALMALPGRGTRLAWLPLCAFLLATALLRLPPAQKSGLFSERFHTENWKWAVGTLLERHRPGEPIFYATHLVELNAVVLGRSSEEGRSFSTWPVAAHMAPAQRDALRALPYRETPETTPLLSERLDEAASTPRSWVIGTSAIVEPFIRRARQHPHVVVAGRARYGRIYVFQLRAAPGAP
jgi:mannosyltransferase